MGTGASASLSLALSSASEDDLRNAVECMLGEHRKRLIAALSEAVSFDGNRTKTAMSASFLVSADAGLDALKMHVVAALPSWQKVVTDPNSQVDIRSITESGLGGGTFKLSIIASELCSHSAVVLHIRGEDERPFRYLRMASCQAAWASQGISPSRLAEGTNWYIDPFEGEQCVVASEKDVFALGKTVAKLHSADTRWFDRFREEILRDHPSIQSLGCQSSQVWQILCRSEHRLKKALGGVFAEDTREQVAWPREVVEAFCDGGAIKPSHPILQRVVGFHGDLHSKNIIMQDSEQGKSYKIIDYEFVGVGAAVIDIGMLLCNMQPPFSYASKTKLIEGYFVGLDLETPTKEEIDQILFDSHLYLFGMWVDDVGYFDLCRASPEEFKRQNSLLQEFAASLRTSPQLRADVIAGTNLHDLWQAHLEVKASPA